MRDPNPTPASLLEHPLNRAALRLLKLEGKPVVKGKFPLSEAILEELMSWNPRGNRGLQVLPRLARLGEAETPEQFAEALRPFMGPLAWDPRQAETEGYPPYGPETLEHYTPSHLSAEAGKCHSLMELLNLLEGQEAKTYELTV